MHAALHPVTLSLSRPEVEGRGNPVEDGVFQGSMTGVGIASYSQRHSVEDYGGLLQKSWDKS